MPKFSPHDWQEADLQKIEAAGWNALLNIEVGGGKTLEALWCVERSGSERVLVVAPDATHQSAWVPKIRDILGLEARIIGNTGKAKKAALFDMVMGYPGVYLTTPQFVTRADISEWQGDFIIVDEGHMLNNRGKAGQRKLSGATFQESQVSLAARYPRRLFLSGTAWRNNFERAWAVARFLEPEKDRRYDPAHINYWVWLDDRMTKETVYVGGRDAHGKPRTAKKWLNEEEPGRLVSELGCVVIHKRWEACCVFHPNGFMEFEDARVTEHIIELHPKQKKAIRELNDFMLTWLDDNPMIVDLPITLQMRLRQICLAVPTVDYVVDEDGVERAVVSFEDDAPSPFADELLRMLEELNGENVVVWTSSQKFAAMLTKRLNKFGYSAFEFSGATKKTRDADMARFGDEFQVMVAVIAAGGAGIDGLQRKSSISVFADTDVDMTNNIQAEGRLSRTGAMRREDRHIFMDSEGFAHGRISDQVARRLALAKTLRSAV